MTESSEKPLLSAVGQDEDGLGPSLDSPADFEVVEGAWISGQNAGSTSPEEIRSLLDRDIRLERDAALTAPDRMFAGALIEVLGVPDLRLPDFPETATKLDQQLATLEPNYSQVMHTIEADPNLVGRIWSLARTTRFPSPPNNLQIAVSRVGLVEIWRMSVEMALEAIRIRRGPFKDRADGVRIHGVLVGDVTASLARETRGPEFLAGLLHDVGELLILEAASRTEPSQEMVCRIVAQHHASFGVLVAKAWRLDPEVGQGIAYHHDPGAVNAGPQDLCRLIRIADIAVSGALDHRRQRQSFPELAIRQAATGPMDPTRPLVLAQRCIDRLERDGMNLMGTAV